MKVIDKTPLQDEKGEISRFQRVRGTLEYGLGWYAEMEAQKAVMAQLDQILEKGFTLIRNITLGNSSITEPLVLVGPPGIYVLYVTPLAGFYEAKGDQWNVVKSGHSYPAGSNLMSIVARLARALQVFLDRQGVNLPGAVEPVLMSSNPAAHIDSLRPMVRVVLSDAVKQFGASLLQAGPVLRPELAHDVVDHVLNPRPKAAGLQPEAEAAPEETPTDAGPSRARAIFQAGGESKPFDPADLSFAFDESAQGGVPANVRETSPSQPAGQSARRGGFRTVHWATLGAMVLAECLILGWFAYIIFTNSR